MKYRPEILRSARLIKGLTQTELAEETGLSITTVNAVEHGKAPWLKAIRTIAAKLDVPLAEVIVVHGGKRKTDPVITGSGLPVPRTPLAEHQLVESTKRRRA